MAIRPALFLFLLTSLAAALPRASWQDARGSSTPNTNTTSHPAFSISNPNALDIIENRFIVVYSSSSTDDAVLTHQAFYAAALQRRNLNRRSLRDGRALSTTVRAYNMSGGWRAMALDADDDMIGDIAGADEVEYVEADTRVSISMAVEQTNAPTGLNRISHSKTGAETYVFDDSAGEGITAYVVDTGILTTHSEFDGRATFGANFINSNVCRPTHPARNSLRH
jgi:hypothetical protein